MFLCDDDESATRHYGPCCSSSGLVQQRGSADYGHKLFGSIVAGNSPRHRLQTGSVSTGQYDCPSISHVNCVLLLSSSNNHESSQKEDPYKNLATKRHIRHKTIV